MHFLRGVVVTALCCLVASLSPAVASAGPASLTQSSDGVLTFRTGEPTADNNVVTVIYDAESFEYEFEAPNLDFPKSTLPASCRTVLYTSRIFCSGIGVSTLAVEGSGESEFYDINVTDTSVPFTLNAAGGDDEIKARGALQSTTLLHGAEGNDKIYAIGGRFKAIGGRGDDDLYRLISYDSDEPQGRGLFSGQEGDDVIHDINLTVDTASGGPGTDYFYTEGDGSAYWYSAGSADRITISLDDVANESVEEIDDELDNTYKTIGRGGNVHGDFEFVLGADEINRFDATLSSVPVTLMGRGGDDQLTGSRFSDALVGGEGDDLMVGGAGSDRFIEERGDSEGSDTVSYANSPARVSVSVGTGINDGRKGEQDDVSNGIDNVIGSRFNDRLSGWKNLKVRLFGGPGDDKIFLPSGTAYGSRAYCGTGNDYVTGFKTRGHLDDAEVDCEVFTRSKSLIRFGVQGETSPWLSVQVPKVRRSGATITAPAKCVRRTKDFCKTSLRAYVKGKLVGTTSQTIKSGATGVLYLRTSRAVSSYKLVIKVTDGRGKSKVSKATIKPRVN